jgi:aldose 1-epimerase
MAPRFEIQTANEPNLNNAEVYILRDNQSGAEARVAPSVGNNLYSIKVPVRGAPVEVFLAPDGSGSNRFGNPILFPFMNRIRYGRFSFGGRDVQVDLNQSGHAIHGFVMARPWQVGKAVATDSGATLTASLNSADFPDIGRQWPWPFQVSATYTLSGNNVQMNVEGRNTGTEMMPVGFGVHCWILMPLTTAGKRADCLVKVPASQQWELEPVFIPSGKVVPVPADRDFRQMKPIGDLELDDVYTGVVRQPDGSTECVMRDPVTGAEVAVWADRETREWCVYTTHRVPTICFEPYPAATDFLNMTSRGIDAGMVTVAPGQAWRTTLRFQLREV